MKKQKTKEKQMGILLPQPVHLFLKGLAAKRELSGGLSELVRKYIAKGLKEEGRDGERLSLLLEK